MSTDDRPTRPTSPDPADAATNDAATNDDLEDTMTTPTVSGAPPTTPDTPAPTDAPSTPAPAPHAPGRSLRIGTIVWGLVLTAIGVGILAFALGVTFDVQLASIAVIAAAGVLLLVGSVATSRRRRG